MIEIYDTTLRDGTQGEGISFSLNDKLKITKKLDNLGVHYIEGGWSGSNPKDTLFFKKVGSVKLNRAVVTAFGSTRRANVSAEEDTSMKSILDSGADVATIFGKSWDFHVMEVLKTTLENNLEMIRDSIRFLRSNGLRVIYDAEHFFDGFKKNADYAMQTVEAAQSAGAETIVLCDTNGGTMPFEVSNIVEEVKKRTTVPLGIHAHNDGGTAVANSMMAVKSGVVQVQGTINGYGERCGNADLCTIIPNLKIKLNLDCIADSQLKNLTRVSRYVSELANLVPRNDQPYVGKSAFTHKGGAHVDAVLKNADSYEHTNPESVGNSRRLLISELAGKRNILSKAKEHGVDLSLAKTKEILNTVKSLENDGYQFEGAEGSFVLLLKRALGEDNPLFDAESFEVVIKKDHKGITANATVELELDGKRVIASSMGDGPVDALNRALKDVLTPIYPELKLIRLTDYKVRVLDAKSGTAAKVRVLIDSSDGKKTWSTVGVSTNIIEASWNAILDALEYGSV
ncbi:MAG TPA: citramalate synthase [Thermoplasmata archaeon]|nr:citramalate synthase [Thermoplasmata archaeon]